MIDSVIEEIEDVPEYNKVNGYQFFRKKGGGSSW
jgi:hypothetical protein